MGVGMNPYVIPSLIVFVISVCLGFYILYKNPKERVNRVFALFMLVSAFFFFSEFMTRAATSVESALTWGKLSSANSFLLTSIFVHFTFVFPKRAAKGRYTIPILFYVFAALLFPLTIGTNLIASGIHRVDYGFDIMGGPAYPVLLIYALSAVGCAIFKLVRSYTQARLEIERKQLRLLVFGAFAASAYGFIVYWLVWPALGSLAILIVAIFILYALLKYKLFVIPSLPRFFIPTPEERLRTKLKYRLREGRCYLVKEREFIRGPKIFMDITKHGIPGLWLTSLHPSKLCEEYGLSKTPVLSLTPERITGEMTVSPNKLDRVREIASGYLSRIHGRSVIMLDCLRELVVANGFEQAMNFLGDMTDLCSQNNSNLIVQVDPDKFSKDQLAEIEKRLHASGEKI
jgi:hypothetical protein